jgi:hydroxymethylpyrimidine/phosphomethylpyrimidine kinase
MTSSPISPESVAEDELSADDDSPVLVMSFNASDPIGATGMAADQLATSSCGGHLLPVICAIHVRDSSSSILLSELDDDLIEEQARTVLEDMDVDVFKIGFVGSPEALAVVAEITSDYEDVPVIVQATPLSWWDRDKIEAYLDALTELVLPQASVLVGNYDTLWRWLLPDWSSDKRPSARDIATGAAQHGVPYVVITGMNTTVDTQDTVVATPESVLVTISLERLDARFLGAGDTFSASLCTLLATGEELIDAVKEASIYVNRSLMAAFQVGMGAAIPDRLFWAQVSEDDVDAGQEDETQTSDPANMLDQLRSTTRH